jgi:hypothetical protein
MDWRRRVSERASYVGAGVLFTLCMTWLIFTLMV